MNIAEINPYIRVAIHSELPAPFYIKTRVIFDYELIYIEKGDLFLTYDSKKWYCQEGDILLLCPGISHSFQVSDVTLIQPHIHFDMKYDSYSESLYVCYKDYSELTPVEKSMVRENLFPNQDGSPFLKISDTKAFLKVFYDVIDSGNATVLKPISRKAKMLMLLEMIISENTSISMHQQPNSIGIAPHIKAFIRANYHQNITLDMLAQHFGYSKFYIEKVFQKAYGTSVIKYRNQKRMEAALQLLTKHSVSETAYMLGYSSIYTFSNAFRDFYGESPTRYLNNRYNR